MALGPGGSLAGSIGKGTAGDRSKSAGAGPSAYGGLTYGGTAGYTFTPSNAGTSSKFRTGSDFSGAFPTDSKTGVVGPRADVHHRALAARSVPIP